MPKTCKKHDALCIDSRGFEGYRRRRYWCRKCEARWSTVEVPVELKRGGKKFNAREQLVESLGGNITHRQSTAIQELVRSFIEVEQ